MLNVPPASVVPLTAGAIRPRSGELVRRSELGVRVASTATRATAITASTAAAVNENRRPPAGASATTTGPGSEAGAPGTPALSLTTPPR